MEDIEVALANYISILRKEREPKFKALKTYPVDFDQTLSFDDLFELHDSALHLLKSGEQDKGMGGTSLLDLKLMLAVKMFESCRLCERRCGVNRAEGQKGRCGVLEPRISSEFMHFGRSRSLSPRIPYSSPAAPSSASSARTVTSASIQQGANTSLQGLWTT